MKAKQQAEKEAKDAGNDEDKPSLNPQEAQPQAEPQQANAVVFDGGFFQVESPAKPSGGREVTTRQRPCFSCHVSMFACVFCVAGLITVSLCCFCRFIEAIQPFERCRAASGLSLLQLPLTKKSHSAIPRTGTDPRSHHLLSCSARPHSRPVPSYPQPNPSTSTKVSVRHPSVIPHQKGHCKCLPLFLTCQRSAARWHPA